MCDWQKAQDYVREWEAREVEPKTTAEPMTIQQAEEKYLADATARCLNESTIYRAVQAAQSRGRAGTAQVGTAERPDGQAAVVFVRKAERPEQQRCGNCGRLFGERGREHKTENLETRVRAEFDRLHSGTQKGKPQ